ncbi:MAG: exosortase A [Aliiglaciecola sp.]
MTFLRSSIFKYLVGLFVVWGAVFYNSIASAVEIWYRSETFAHCFIILPICIYLIKLKWAALNNATLKPSYVSLIFVTGTLLIWLFGSMAQVKVIEQYAAFAMLPMLIWTVMGNQVARILLFASFFWLFSVPAGEFLIPQLQELTADITVLAIELTGIPVYREGLYIAIPNGLFEVAVACSGIRYLIASFTLGTLFAYLNYNKLNKRLIFIAFSIVLPLLANGIRAYGIVMIAYLSDMKYATGVDHLVYGWLFFGVVILIMFTVGGKWADPLPEKEISNNPTGPKTPVNEMLKAFSLMAAVIAGAYIYKVAFENVVSDVQPNISSIFSAGKPIEDQSWLPNYRNASDELSGHDGGFDYYYAYYNANLQGQELINAVNSLYNIENWSIVKDDRNERYRVIEITDVAGNRRLLAYSYVTPWHMTHKALEIKLVQAIQAILGQPQNGFVLFISKQLENEKVDRQALEQSADKLFSEKLKALVND